MAAIIYFFYNYLIFIFRPLFVFPYFLQTNIISSVLLYLRYFPANFVTTDALEARGDTPTDPPEIVGSPPQRVSTGGDSSEQTCVALFDYVSDEPGDLSFQAGETIIIVKKVSNAIDHLFKLKTDQSDQIVSYYD